MSRDNNIWANINLAQLRRNLHILNNYKSSNTKIMPVLKANAYGNGAVALGTYLQALGIKYFGVADLEEGLQLRQSGITADILVMNPILPTDLPYFIDQDIIIMIGSLAQARKLAIICSKMRSHRQLLSVHVRIDVAHSGLGVNPSELNDLLKTLANIPQVKITGIFTHLYAAYSDDSVEFYRQLNTFQRSVHSLPIPIPTLHAASSAAFLKEPESHYDLVRIGTSLYGYLAYDNQIELGLEPIMELKTRIVDIIEFPWGKVKDYFPGTEVKGEVRRVAILPLGYKHFLGLLSIKEGWGMLKGIKVPFLGKPCMNHTVIDITNIPHVELGEVVTLWGNSPNMKDSSLGWAEQLNLNVVHHVVLGMLNENVPRIYTLEDQKSQHVSLLEERSG